MPTISAAVTFHNPQSEAKSTTSYRGAAFHYARLVMAQSSPGQTAVRLLLRDDSDVAQARLRVRELCVRHGFTPISIEALVIAASEIARNALVHGREGELTIGTVHEGERIGVVVTARDSGPGIASIETAMRDGYSTGDGLGLGLPSARRLVHEFEIQSASGQGTEVKLVMWCAP
jgi:serine/threonine-protein kinase RsbT